MFYVITGRSARPTPFGDSIFLLVKKDRGERHAKGLQSRPLESGFYTGVRRGDVPTLYVFARVQLTRFRPARRRAGGVRFTRLRRKARHHLFSAISLPKALLPPDSIVLLRLRRIRNTYRITSLICGRQSGGCEGISIFHGSAARRGKGVSDSAAADLIASHAPLRNGSHKARQNGPKH